MTKTTSRLLAALKDRFAILLGSLSLFTSSYSLTLPTYLIFTHIVESGAGADFFFFVDQVHNSSKFPPPLSFINLCHASKKMIDQEREAVEDDKRQITEYMKIHRLEELFNEVNAH